MQKVLTDDPFLEDTFRVEKPLYAAVPSAIFKGSHFERKFVIPFGSVREKLAFVAVGKENVIWVQN